LEVKIDASKDFEAITSRVATIKMAADLVGDEEVYEAMVVVFCQLVMNMFVTIPSGRGEAYMALTRKRYDEMLHELGLKRLVED
jgi:hypothetical protein